MIVAGNGTVLDIGICLCEDDIARLGSCTAHRHTHATDTNGQGCRCRDGVDQGAFDGMHRNIAGGRLDIAVGDESRNVIVDHVVGQGHADRNGHARAAESAGYGGCSAIGHDL